jgi:hypothetical protein
MTNLRRGGGQRQLVSHDRPRSCDTSSDAFPLCGKRIKVDELRIVGTKLALESFAAMNVNQCLHTPGIQMIYMPMPQRDRQQRFGQLNE